MKMLKRIMKEAGFILAVTTVISILSLILFSCLMLISLALMHVNTFLLAQEPILRGLYILSASIVAHGFFTKRKENNVNIKVNSKDGLTYSRK